MLEGLIDIVFRMLIKKFSAILSIHHNDVEHKADNNQNLNIMYGIKVILATTAMSCILAAVILLWLEEQATCGTFTCKSVETLLIITGVMLTKEATSIKIR